MKKLLLILLALAPIVLCAETEEQAMLRQIEAEYGSVENFLNESAKHVMAGVGAIVKKRVAIARVLRDYKNRCITKTAQRFADLYITVFESSDEECVVLVGQGLPADWVLAFAAVATDSAKLSLQERELVEALCKAIAEFPDALPDLN